MALYDLVYSLRLTSAVRTYAKFLVSLCVSSFCSKFDTNDPLSIYYIKLAPHVPYRLTFKRSTRKNSTMSEAKFDLSANQVVVEKSNIQPGTRQGYFNKLILLVQFCFDHTSYHDLIQTHLVNDLIVANDKDRNLPQKKAKQRKHLRKAITKMLKKYEAI